MEYRQIAIRAVDKGARIVSGIAVPYDREENGELFEYGAANVADDAKLFAYHETPIGKIVEHSHTPEGLSVRAYISATAAGDDIYQLLLDGVLDTFSVGFDSAVSERREDGTTVIKSARIREVSVVPFGWYHQGAKISEVREEPTEETATTVAVEEEPLDGSEEEKEETVTDITVDPSADIAELRQSVEGMERTIATMGQRSEAPAFKFRHVGELVKGLIAGDSIAQDEYKRVYTGGVVADTYDKDAWVGEWINVVDEAAVLRTVFQRRATPAKGMNVEFGVLDANTLAVTEQEAEGDTLDSGKISVTTATAPIKTYGGTSTLSIQEIERTDPDMLNLTLLGLARKAGQRLNTAMRAHYETEVAAQVTAANVVEYPATGAGYTDFLDAVVEAAHKFQTNGLDISALIVDKALYKQLVTLEASDGRPVFLVDAAAQGNIAGRLNLVGLSGSLVGIPVVCDTLLDGSAAFVNSAAITAWESPIAQLQDTGIADLTRSFGAYMYAAQGSTIPAGIVPLVTAS